jgi:hypothetical protein
MPSKDVPWNYIGSVGGYTGSPYFTLEDALEWAKTSKEAAKFVCYHVLQGSDRACGGYSGKGIWGFVGAVLFGAGFALIILAPGVVAGGFLDFVGTGGAGTLSAGASGATVGAGFVRAGTELGIAGGDLGVSLGEDIGEDGWVLNLLGKCNSFASATKVAMADGGTKQISHVKLGDKVLSTNPETGKTTPRSVTALHRNQDTDLTDLTLADSKGSRITVHTTQHHPFYNNSFHAWIDASKLQPGDKLRSLTGDTITVVSARSFTGNQPMYNLTVDTDHTYYVLAGSAPVLVHNTNGCDPAMLDDMSEAYVRGKHLPGGANVTRDKSVFNAGVDLDDLVARGNNCACQGPNASGFYERNVNHGSPVGRLSEDAGGLPTSWYKVVQDKYGGVITMYPIAPPG